MSLVYEGLSAEISAVVLDIGSRYTKFGFVGEFAPRCIIPTVAKCPKTGEDRRVYDYTDQADLYALLVNFVHKLYFKHVLVSPKDRNVVIIESLLCPTLFRDTLASVLFRHYEVASILFVPSHLVAVCALGIRSALVVDVGYQESQVIPIYEGVPVLAAWEAQPLAGQAIERRLKDNLLKAYKEVKNAPDSIEAAQDIESLSDSVVEDIKIRACFATNLKRGRQIEDGVTPKQPPSVDYRLDGDRIVKIPGWVREASCEILFEKDNDESSLPNIILDSILKCSIDTRKTLAENIVIMGGTSMLPGFKARLLDEIRDTLKSPAYNTKSAISSIKMHNPPSKDNYTSWLGGAIFGATDMIPMRALTRENYLSLNTVPDWSNLSTNALIISRLTI